ncbi:MAG: hypothetical protein J1E34_05920 [Oscillospiraceae bacterium]|nr:hypothetical protein [Oscillospiraceae bacterium]
MKKYLSVFLVGIMLLLTAAPVFAAEKKGADVPNVYVQGQGAAIINPEGKNVYNDKFDDSEYLLNAIKDCLPSFFEAVTTDTDEAWNAYNERLDSWIEDGFDDFFLDKNGEVSNGTHVSNLWNGGPLRDVKRADGYAVKAYEFIKDWRLDPCYNAALLSDYIDAVKAATGSDKVNLIGRCEGANIVMAYLAEYGEKNDLNCVVLYVSSANGIDSVSSFFSGNIYIDTDSLIRYKNQALKIDDEATAELIDTLVEFTTNTHILNVAALTVSALMKKVYTKTITGVLRKTYATMPGIWSLVTADEYKDAIKGVFGGHEEEYACLIEKLDHYDKTVRQRTDEIIKEAKARGVKVANFAKYGEYQIPPLAKTSNEYSDGFISVKYASMGATSPKYGRLLSDTYLKNAAKNGTDKYISPDKVIDASTCVLPDTTWFIYNSEHSEFPETIDVYILKFLRANGEMTVFSDPEMPQYLSCDDDANVSIMTEENGMKPEGTEYLKNKLEWRDMIFRFLKAVYNFIKQLINNRFS